MTGLPSATIGPVNAIADALFDHGRIIDKLPPMNRDGFREIIGAAIAEWASQDQATVDEKFADAASGITDHLDSLEGQLRYFLGRVKAIPTYEMIDLVVLNIRERLSKIRALAAPQPAQADAPAEPREPLNDVLFNNDESLEMAADALDRLGHDSAAAGVRAVAYELRMLAHKTRCAPADAGEARLTERFITEFGHRLATLLKIDAYDIADRDAQIATLLNGADHDQ
ncbi:MULTISPECIES: hypothetical protein [Burkholderia]|uniref:hypothetical protein n=1 Tax=Burkholderia TaxID=32008 RepID=UPI0012BBB8E4|nr:MULTISPECIES: hypothetical protein [Burkholderia]